MAFPKNFSSLISAWKYVIERHADWTLEIWGEGELRTELEEQIRNNQLTNNIFLKGYTYDIFSPLYEASIFTLTSLFEGLPIGYHRSHVLWSSRRLIRLPLWTAGHHSRRA